MIIRNLTSFFAIALPALGLSQLGIFDAAYQVTADARSGSSFDTHSSSSNSVGPLQSYSDQVDSYASSTTTFPPSTVHSWAGVTWNCTPTDLDAGLVACWDSFDYGAGNSGHMLSRLNLGISLSTACIITTVGTFDPANSSMAIDRWNINFSRWDPFITSTQIVNYAGVWQPGDYLFKAQRIYNPVGNSTGCVPLNFHLHAAPLVPEPASILALGTGVALLHRRRKTKLR